MSKYDKYYAAQDFILDLVKKELVGPVEEDEIIESYPLQSYVSGILWAQRWDAEKNDFFPDESREVNLPFEGEDAPVYDLTMVDSEEGEGMMHNAFKRKPSTMGISCIIAPDEKMVRAVFSFARYTHSESVKTYGDNKTALSHKWERRADVIELEFDFAGDCSLYRASDESTLNERNIEIVATVRKTNSDGSRLVTFTATNSIMAQNQDIVQNESALFQCELKLVASSAFLPIEHGYYASDDVEEEMLKMQYRNVKNFAQGHGCAAKAVSANEIVSSFLPTVEVNQMRSLDTDDAQLFSLRYLFSGNRPEILEKASAFLAKYRGFKEEQALAAAGLNEFKKAAEKVIGNIDICIKRIEKGISILSNNEAAWRAFQLCNKAMYEQRISMELKRGKIMARSDYSDDPKWYPFQLFYLIMIIPDIAGEGAEFNDAVDLLYFPTGGGKTEAYFAVSAFTIFYERITKPKIEHGVMILMRYTLRLLTIQQFERAAALICACEQIRIEENIGGNEISIGLWIGGDTVPNKISGAGGAQELLEKIMKDGMNSVKSNPIQITSCPCCGKRLDVLNYSIVEQGMRIKCPNGCLGDHLPIYIIDEDIYNNKPTLVISTVDKFARIVWEARTSALFGVGEREAPPRLIIQDELHLISGPLGTLTGVYEAAIDKLCSKGASKPKVIASTATVKRSGVQIMKLYNRKVFQFPPNGINATSSFFAVESRRGEKEEVERPCRTYVGLSEQGGSMLDLFLRVFSAVNLANYYLHFTNTPISAIDHYYTLVGYFNALRDLGTSSTTLKERMISYINSLLNNKFKKMSDELGLPKGKIKFKTLKDGSEVITEKEGGYKYGLFPNCEHVKSIMSAELTSRRSAVEIKDMLDGLSNSLLDASLAKSDQTYNYVLASNMFSVGVDINRLGMMLVYGQPKSNSEYIQSTSRVGRSNPGMIFTALNAFRSRDRSFYENFYDYHNNFYKYVEATSVTPFSIRSIEKALHSVFVALVRHTVPGHRFNKDASAFRKTDDRIIAIKNFLIERVRAVQPNAVEFAIAYLDEFIEFWHDDAQGGILVYDKNKEGRDSGKSCPLLSAAETEENCLYKTLNSVRNVEGSSNIFVRK